MAKEGEGEWFVSPTNLHCSQTKSKANVFIYEFVSPTNLHCSQTDLSREVVQQGLFPLRIYTALKHTHQILLQNQRLFPLRIYTALKR